MGNGAGALAGCGAIRGDGAIGRAGFSAGGDRVTMVDPVTNGAGESPAASRGIRDRGEELRAVISDPCRGVCMIKALGG